MQYSGGGLMVFERRLDQTLGKPGAWMVTTDNEKQRLTVVVRLTRIEGQASIYTNNSIQNRRGVSTEWTGLDMSRLGWTCPDLCGHVQTGVDMSRPGWTCPDWCAHVQTGVDMSRPGWTCPDWGGHVQIGVDMSRLGWACPDWVDISRLGWACPDWGVHVQIGVDISRLVWTCPDWGGHVQTGVDMSRLEWTCPPHFCRRVFSGLMQIRSLTPRPGVTGPRWGLGLQTPL